jgi:peptidoglycan-N-acetylglucosamine deacetylase
VFDLTLSFDNGPEAKVTPGMLAFLGRREIKATFLAIGEKIAGPARRALAERAQAEDHWIGNHTYAHRVPLGREADAAVAESDIAGTQALLGELAAPERLFRPCGGGHLNDGLFGSSIVKYLEREHYTCVL